MAIPNPERELQRLDQATQGGLPRCVLVTGASQFFRTSAFDSLLARVPATTELRIADGEQAGDGGELALLRGGGLFARHTCLAVRRADAWLARHGEEVERLLPKMPKTAALLLETKKLDKRLRLSKLLLEAGPSFEMRDLYAEPYDRSSSPLDAELVAWLVARSRAARVPLTPEGAFMLITSVGKEPGELLAELARLAPGVAPGARALGPEELRGKLTASFQATPFELADALLARDRRQALRALKAMYERGVPGRDGDAVDRGGVFPFVTSWLYTSLAQALAGRALLDAGVPPDELASRAGVRVFQDRFRRQVAKNSKAQLEHALARLLDVQRELRTTGEDPELLLESFVARCLAAGAP